MYENEAEYPYLTFKHEPFLTFEKILVVVF